MLGFDRFPNARHPPDVGRLLWGDAAMLARIIHEEPRISPRGFTSFSGNQTTIRFEWIH